MHRLIVPLEKQFMLGIWNVAKVGLYVQLECFGVLRMPYYRWNVTVCTEALGKTMMLFETYKDAEAFIKSCTELEP